MNNLITLTTDTNYPIDGRELHASLEVGTEYRHWFPRVCEYGFAEGADFNAVKIERVQIEGGREVTREVITHKMTLGMAKEICMLQRTEKGREVRRYLIAVEEKWNQPEAVMARALQMADVRIKELAGAVAQLEEKAQADADKVAFANCVTASERVITLGQMAKLLCQNGVEIGRDRLCAQLRKEGFLCKSEREWNMPTQYAVKKGLLEIEEVTVGKRKLVTCLVTRVTGKGQVYFVDRYLRKQAEEDTAYSFYA